MTPIYFIYHSLLCTTIYGLELDAPKQLSWIVHFLSSNSKNVKKKLQMCIVLKYVHWPPNMLIYVLQRCIFSLQTIKTIRTLARCNLVNYIYSIFITKVRIICIFYRKNKPTARALQVYRSFEINYTKHACSSLEVGAKNWSSVTKN